MSRSVAGLFPDRASADAAKRLFHDVGYGRERVTMLSTVDGELPLLRQRPECIFSRAVRGAIEGALVLEVPIVLALLLLPVDMTVRVFMAASVWKAGALIGAWFGVLLGQDHGLESEVAERYQRHFQLGRVVVAVDAPSRDLPSVRGVLLESGALEARDVDGTFETKPGPRPARALQPR